MYKDEFKGRNAAPPPTTAFVELMPPPLAKKKTNVAPVAPFGECVMCHIKGSNYEHDYKEDKVLIMDLAEPGEDRYPNRLYSLIWMPMNQMGDYGLGVSHHQMVE